MQPFAHLSKLERTRRLRHLAYAALDHYLVSVETLRCVSLRYSTIFRVETTDSRRYALRINAPRQRTRQMIFSEMSWVEALAQESSVHVAAPLRTAEGNLLVAAPATDAAEVYHVVLTEWLEGQLVTQYPDAQSFVLLGEAMARLHQHARTYRPPSGFMQEQLDTPWQWGEPYYLQPHSHLLTPDQKVIVKAAQERCEAWLATIYAKPTCIHFLHADLHLKNAFLHQGNLQIFDFDDSMWGHPLQDLAVPLYWIATRLNDAPQLKAALLQGYSRHLPFPYSTVQLNDAVLFRALQVTNFLIHYRLSTAPDAVNAALHFLQTYLD